MYTAKWYNETIKVILRVFFYYFASLIQNWKYSARKTQHTYIHAQNQSIATSEAVKIALIS